MSKWREDEAAVSGEVSEQDTADLVRRAQNRDTEAYTRLARAHEARVYRQALVLCGNAAEAEDLAAETLIAAWESMSGYRGGARFSTWLYGILLHRYQKRVRRQRCRPLPLSTLTLREAEWRETELHRLPAGECGAAESLMRRELAGTLRAAIDQLPAAQQAVVCLRFLEGASLAEMAATLGVPIGTVKSRLHHALRSLGRMPQVMNLLTELEDTQI